jgi:hypothetical protein
MSYKFTELLLILALSLLPFVSNSVFAMEVNAPRILLKGAGDSDFVPLNSSNAVIITSNTLSDPAKWAFRLDFRLYRDLEPVGKVGYYDPAAADPEHDYCFVWAPGGYLKDGLLYLYFSALRVTKGEACPLVHSVDEAGKMQIFWVAFDPASLSQLETSDAAASEIPLESLANTLPTILQNGSEGELKLGYLKIDPFVFEDQLLYVASKIHDSNYGPNNVATVQLTHPVPAPAPSRVLVNGKAYQGIAEGPTTFRGPKRVYLLFQAKMWNGNYSVYYKSAKSLSAIKENSPVASFMKAVERQKCLKPGASPTDPVSYCHHRNYGINRVFQYQGRYYVYYHVLDYDVDHTGYYVRDGWIAPLLIDSSEALVSPVTLDLRLYRAKKTEYSLDLLLHDGQQVSACLHDTRLPKKGAKLLFNGRCDNGEFYGVERIRSLVVYASKDKWVTATSTSYDVDFLQPFYLMK